MDIDGCYHLLKCMTKNETVVLVLTKLKSKEARKAFMNKIEGVPDEGIRILAAHALAEAAQPPPDIEWPFSRHPLESSIVNVADPVSPLPLASTISPPRKAPRLPPYPPLPMSVEVINEAIAMPPIPPPTPVPREMAATVPPPLPPLALEDFRGYSEPPPPMEEEPMEIDIPVFQEEVIPPPPMRRNTIPARRKLKLPPPRELAECRARPGASDGAGVYSFAVEESEKVALSITHFRAR